jgi:hypothetical protein
VVTTVVSVECGAPVERAAAKSSHPAVQDEVGAVEVFEEEVPVVEAAVWKAEFPAGSTVEGRAEEVRVAAEMVGAGMVEATVEATVVAGMGAVTGVVRAAEMRAEATVAAMGAVVKAVKAVMMVVGKAVAMVVAVTVVALVVATEAVVRGEAALAAVEVVGTRAEGRSRCNRYQSRSNRYPSTRTRSPARRRSKRRR